MKDLLERELLKENKTTLSIELQKLNNDVSLDQWYSYSSSENIK